MLLEDEVFLVELFNMWYGTKLRFERTKSEDVSSLTKHTLPAAHIQNQWTNLWFAKGETQKQVDEMFQSQYLQLISRDLQYHPEHLNTIQQLALIILYDQLSRNLFRRTAKAYAYDHKSRSLALGIIHNEGLYESLGLQYKLTLLICLLHSEDLPIQNLVSSHVAQLNENGELQPHSALLVQLKHISNNHRERVLNFGRIPERNLYLGRPSTDSETAYLNALK
uniref:Uncharacterized protein n=1 Tax=Arcella intermedia TaxID=1963864 RepID=A0A6B2LGS6_9EUKA